MVHLKVDKKIDLKVLTTKKKKVSMWCDECVNLIVIINSQLSNHNLYILKLPDAICQLHLNKAGDKRQF